MRIVSKEAWYGTEQGQRVPERHPLARFLIVAAGAEIEESELERYPILKGSEVPREAPREKAIDRAPETKEVKQPKAAKKPKATKKAGKR